MKPPQGAETLADARDRMVACSTFEKPVILEAGAGTGKTAVLVARTLTWMLGAGWERARARAGDEHEDRDALAARVAEGVVAITFTRRGAAEMADRIGEALTRVHRGEEVTGLDDRSLERIVADATVRRERAASLLGNLDRLFAGTIHSFCQRLLAAYPLEAGVQPGFRVDDGAGLVHAVCREVLDEGLRGALEGGEGLEAIETLTRDGGVDRILEALETLVAKGVPAEALAGTAYPAERLAARRDELAGICRDLLARIGGPIGESKSGQIKKAREVVAALEEMECTLEDVRDVAGLFAAAASERVSKALVRLKDWGRGTIGKTEEKVFGGQAAGRARSELVGLCGRLHRLLDHMGKLQPELFSAGRRFLEPLVREAHESLRRRGIVSFSALLSGARRLLSDRADVCVAVRSRIDQLLVDEFQDTDPLQCAIIEKLALEGPLEERPGLFLVGDPKQSIYGWRDADLEAYEAFLDTVRSAGGAVCRLDVNFRSVPAILEEVERLVAPVMIERPGMQPPFTPLAPAPHNRDRTGFTAGGRTPVEYWVSWRVDESAAENAKKIHGRTGSDEASRLEARALAADLLELHRDHGVALGDVAILMRTTGRQEIYLEALRSAQIPFVVERDRNYYRRREVVDLSCALRVIADPWDLLALAGFLRSPMAGVPDAALVSLWRSGLPQRCRDLIGPDDSLLGELDRMVNEARCSLPETPGIERVQGWDLSLMAALRTVAVLRRSLAEDPPESFIRKMRQLLMAEAIEGARYLGAYRVANLQRVYRRLVESLTASEGSLEDVLRELREGVARLLEQEEGVVGDESLDAVRVLTIHKAKGLTFDHVYLVGTDAKTSPERARPADAERAVDGMWEMELLGGRSLGFDRMRRRRERVAEAERVRTLYVSITRPRVRLVIAGKWPDPDREPEPTSHLYLLAQTTELPVKAFLESGPAGFGEIRTSTAASRWLLAEDLARKAGTLRASGGMMPERQAMIEMFERLDSARREARDRMARPWVGPFTAEGPEGAMAGAATGRTGRLSREEARDVGTLVHRALERLDLDAPPHEALSRVIEEVSAFGQAVLRRGPESGALCEAISILRGLEGSRLLERLRCLSPAILGREVPVLLAAGGDECGAGGALSGRIDLLYRAPEDGRLVVADYKTEPLADPVPLSGQAAAHLAQGSLYVRAATAALHEDEPARFELWFVRADRIYEVDLAGERDGPIGGGRALL